MAESQFKCADAWLFLAIGYAAKHRNGTLADIVGVADGIQHALPTVEEINGAVGRLARAGYLLGPEGAELRPSEAGRALVDQVDSAGGNIFEKLELLRRLIGSPPWTPDYDPALAQAGESDVITAADLQQALAAYSDSLNGV